MTKKENTSTEVKLLEWYQKAALPWIIISVIASLSGGFIAGYHYSQNLEQTIDARSAQLAEQSKANQ